MPAHRLVTGRDEFITAWVARRNPDSDLIGRRCSTIGIEVNGRLIAGLVYSGYRQNVSIEMSIAADSPRWCRKGVLGAIFAYPFDQLKVRRVQATVCASNARSLKLVRGLGFVHEGTLREAWPTGEDALVFSMLRRDCRWLGVTHNG